MQNKAFPDALAIAGAAADVICKQLEEKPDSLICIAAGHSSLPCKFRKRPCKTF